MNKGTKNITYTLIRSRRKTVIIQLKPDGSVVLRVYPEYHNWHKLLKLHGDALLARAF